jgi:hypothetical protein
MRNKLFMLFLITVSTFIPANLAHGQETVISREEYAKAVYNTAYTKSWRAVSDFELYESGKVIEKSHYLTEHIYPDREHFLESSTVKGETRNTENYRIGDIYYCRSNNGRWRKTNEDCRRYTIEGDLDSPGVTYSVANDVVNGTQAKLYKRKVIRRDFGEGSEVYEDKYWIDESRHTLRIERRITDEKSQQTISLRVSKYEYDPPDQKIQDPIN